MYYTGIFISFGDADVEGYVPALSERCRERKIDVFVYNRKKAKLRCGFHAGAKGVTLFCPVRKLQ